MKLTILIATVVALAGTAHAQRQQTQCVSTFNNGFRQCFRDTINFELEIVFSLVSNGTNAPLPPNLVPQKQNLINTLCGNKQAIYNCINPLKTNSDQTCTQTEVGLKEGTVNAMNQGVAGLCGGPSPSASPCLAQFDAGFRQCLAELNVNQDNFFLLLSNQPLPGGANRDQLKQMACGDGLKTKLLSCATNIVTGLQSQCKPQETITVGSTLRNMLGAYEAVCTGKTTSNNQCMAKFEAGMNTCAQQTLNMDMSLILMVLNNQTLPPGQDPKALKKTICGKWKMAEECGKKVVTSAGCGRLEMLAVEAAFANMMITTATFCGDTSLPGACLLTLQKQFGQCFGKVGLSPDIYLSNATDHKGALIGANMQEAQVYCEKKHDLFTCMQEVMHKCPGAEQTLSLTGFDLHGMERAVGKLCHDIPNYLSGLNCFKDPTDAAKQCMEDMTIGITELSTKQLTQKLSMDSFFADFCSLRVRHVGCDGAAWPTCQKSAVDLKNEFECQLIPSRCYKSHKDNIDSICPNTKFGIPGHDEADIHVHDQPACAQNIKSRISQCFQDYGMQADLFLVNVTQDRSTFMGDSSSARSICSNKVQVFGCMRSALNECPAAKSVLSYWGHQQDSLEKAVNLICKETNLYNKGVRCFANGNAQVQQCISNTESKMMNLADKQISKNLSPDSYFRDFCRISVEHLRCDLAGWRQSCGADVVGLKTELECDLIQEHCRNLQVGNFKSLCNDQTYGTASRQTGGDNGGASISASMATMGGILTAVVVLLL